MSAKIVVVGCLLGLLAAPNAAWSARTSRGECYNAVYQALGKPDQPHAEITAAVRRCMKYGPEAILNEDYAPDTSPAYKY
jgi:hypothetical protein